MLVGVLHRFNFKNHVTECEPEVRVTVVNARAGVASGTTTPASPPLGDAAASATMVQPCCKQQGPEEEDGAMPPRGTHHRGGITFSWPSTLPPPVSVRCRRDNPAQHMDTFRQLALLRAPQLAFKASAGDFFLENETVTLYVLTRVRVCVAGMCVRVWCVVFVCLCLCVRARVCVCLCLCVCVVLHPISTLLRGLHNLLVVVLDGVDCDLPSWLTHGTGLSLISDRYAFHPNTAGVVDLRLVHKAGDAMLHAFIPATTFARDVVTNKLFVQYCITVRFDNTEWSVRRRYRDFKRLHEKVGCICTWVSIYVCELGEQSRACTRVTDYLATCDRRRLLLVVLTYCCLRRCACDCAVP